MNSILIMSEFGWDVYTWCVDYLGNYVVLIQLCERILLITGYISSLYIICWWNYQKQAVVCWFILKKNVLFVWCKISFNKISCSNELYINSIHASAILESKWGLGGRVLKPRKFKGGIGCGSHLAITYGGE